MKEFFEVCKNESSLGRYVDSDGAIKFISLHRYKRFAHLLKHGALSIQTIANMMQGHQKKFWCTENCVDLAFDESMVGFKGIAPGSVVVARKPNPKGFLCYVLAGHTSRFRKPFPLAFFPRDCSDYSFRDAFQDAMRYINQSQEEGALPTPVVVVADALFGSIPLCQKHFPNIRFICSLQSNRFPHYHFLLRNLGFHESRMIAGKDHVISAFQHKGEVVNISTAHEVLFDLPDQVQVEDGVDLDDAVDDPEAEEEEENAGALAPGAKYHYTTQEIDAMKKKDLQVSLLVLQSQVLLHFIQINMQRLVFRYLNYLKKKVC